MSERTGWGWVFIPPPAFTPYPARCFKGCNTPASVSNDVQEYFCARCFLPLLIQANKALAKTA